MSYRHTGIWLALTLSGFFLGSCGHGPRESVPSWVMGVSEEFPAQRYVLGVGEADSRQVAEDRAYAAIAKVFAATVQSQADDTEWYRVQERDGRTTDERTLAIKHSTTVTTSKVLESANVLDRWMHPAQQRYFVLAGIDRHQAESGLREKITNLDETVDAEVKAALLRGLPLEKIGHLTRALEAFREREELNGDLRVIRESGEGISPGYQQSEIARELREMVERHVLLQVAVQGDQASAMRSAIIEGLRKRGLPVRQEHSPPGKEQNDPMEQGSQESNILIQGNVHLWKIDVPDPLFTFVRWCGEFVIVDRVKNRIVGVAGQTGREGHVTEQEAFARAASAMQYSLTKELAARLAQAILSGVQEVSVPPAHACPNDRS